MTSLTTKQEQQLADWIDQARQLEHSAMKYAEILCKIKRSDFWRAKAQTWKQYCYDTFQIKERTAQEWIQLFEFTEERKLLAETNPEVEVPVSLNHAKRLKIGGAGPRASRNIKDVKLEVMSAKHDKSGPLIETNKPSVLPMDLRSVIDSLSKHFDHLLHRADLPYEALQEMRKCAAELNQARHLLQSVLPGLEVVITKPKFKPPTLAEIKSWAHSKGICDSDCEWFFHHMEGTGWKNAGKPVASWEGTLTAWKISKILPSYKQVNGYGKVVLKEKSLALKDAERLEAEIKKLCS